MEIISDHEGVSLSSAEELIFRSEQIENGYYHFKLSEYINGGFKLFFKRPGEFMLYFIVSALISALAGATGFGAFIVLAPLKCWMVYCGSKSRKR